MSKRHHRKDNDKDKKKDRSKNPPIIPGAPSFVPKYLLNEDIPPPIPPPPPSFIRHNKEKDSESTVKEDEGSNKGESNNRLSLPVKSGRLIRSRHVKFRGELPEENLEREEISSENIIPQLPDKEQLSPEEECKKYNDHGYTSTYLVIDGEIFNDNKETFKSRYDIVARCFNKLSDENTKKMIISFFNSYNILNGKTRYFIYDVDGISKVGILNNEFNRNLLINSDGRNIRVNKLVEIFKKKESLGLPNIYNEMIDEPI